MIIKKLFNISKGLVLVGAGTYGAYKVFSTKLFDTAFKRDERHFEVDTKYLDWLKNVKGEDCYIKSFDGLNLHGFKIENHKTNNYVILIHGIWADLKMMSPYAYELDKLGYNILLIDQRTCGKSDGDFYTYGLKESYDLIKWTEYLINLKKDINIVFYGCSMGASTCLMAAKNKLPTSVKCIVEDSGFADLKDEIAFFCKTRYKMNKPLALLNMFNSDLYNKLGFDFSDVKPADALTDNDLPLLIIHGEDDNIVPYEMSKIIYHNQKGEKKFYSVKGKGHCQARLEKNYFKNVDAFIKKYLG